PPSRPPASGHRARVLRGADPDGDRLAPRRAAWHGEDAGPARHGAAPECPGRRSVASAMTREEIRELAALYALGGLDGADLERFEALLRSRDPEATSALGEFE